jgi:hypothetical protein
VGEDIPVMNTHVMLVLECQCVDIDGPHGDYQQILMCLRQDLVVEQWQCYLHDPGEHDVANGYAAS